MRHWWLLATRNWRARPGRAAGTALAIALGVGTVVWVTSSYESVRRSISDKIVDRWVGKSHLSIESSLGHWGRIDQAMVGVAGQLDGVRGVTARLRRRMNLVIAPDMSSRPDENLVLGGSVLAVDAVGIEPATEYTFRTYDVHGRFLEPRDRGVAIIETKTARELGIRIGDGIKLYQRALVPSRTLEIVGLYDAQRIAKFQKPTVLLTLPDLQDITDDAGVVTIVDVMLADPTPENLGRAADALRTTIQERGLGYQVTSSIAKLRQLEQAQRQTEFVLTLVAGVALLTAFFVISTTMSMGMMERSRQMGMLRCIGATRPQIAGLVFAEVAPLGVIGLLAGVPVGLGLTYGGALMAPEYVPEIAVSVRGITVALVGGALATLGAGLLPALQALSVSPLAASRPQAKPAAGYLPLLVALIGAGMVGVHTWMVASVDPAHWMSPPVALTGISLLYIGYALMTPLAVQLLGGLFVQLVARLLRLNPRLLNEQISGAVWRGGGICCGLMTGLGLLIGVLVCAESIRAGWDFPKRIAEAFVWTRAPVPRVYAAKVRAIPGVEACTVVNDFLADIGQSRSRFFKMFNLKSVFVAGEPDVFLNMTKLEFLEGDRQDAGAKLRQGGYILLPPEASRAFGFHLGDKVPITASGRTVTFEVAGVVQSPALDVAVTYFQADTYMMVAAANSVLGTLDDAKKHFGIDAVSLFLMNFSLPNTAPPELFHHDRPPDVNDSLVARELLEWGDLLTNDLEEMKLLRPRLERWIGYDPSLKAVGPATPAGLRHEGGHAETDTSPPYGLAPYRLALKYLAERWHNQTPQQRWEMFCDRLIMHHVMTAVNRPNAIFGSLRELKAQIDNDIRAATLLLAAIPIVALFVAAIGVGNLMMANVLNRTREVGVLRSLGATQWQIMRLVLGEAIVLGVIGSAAGLALGIHDAHSTNELTLRAIGFAPSLQLPTADIVFGITLTVGVCLLAGLSPARYAARSNVIDAIRSV